MNNYCLVNIYVRRIENIPTKNNLLLPENNAEYRLISSSLILDIYEIGESKYFNNSSQIFSSLRIFLHHLKRNFY